MRARFNETPRATSALNVFSMSLRGASHRLLCPEWRDCELIGFAEAKVKLMPDDGSADAFVAIGEVERAGPTDLVEGQRVSYELLSDKHIRKTYAAKLKLATQKNIFLPIITMHNGI